MDLARLFDERAFRETSCELFENSLSFELACIQMLHHKIVDFILLELKDSLKPSSCCFDFCYPPHLSQSRHPHLRFKSIYLSIPHPQNDYLSFKSNFSKV